MSQSNNENNLNADKQEEQSASQGDPRCTKIYIIEQNDGTNGFYGVQGIYSNYDTANVVFKTLTNSRDFEDIESYPEHIISDVNFKIIKSVSSKSKSIFYQLIEILTEVSI